MKKDYTLPLNKLYAATAIGSYTILVLWCALLTYISAHPQKFPPITPGKVTIVQTASLVLTLTLIFLRARSESRIASYYVRYGLWGKVGLFVIFMIFPIGDFTYLLTDGRPTVVFPFFMQISELSSIKIADTVKKKYYAYAQDDIDPALIVVTTIGEITVLIKEEIARVDLFLLGEEGSISPEISLSPEWKVEWSKAHDAYAFTASCSYYPECNEDELGEIIIDIIDKLVGCYYAN